MYFVRQVLITTKLDRKQVEDLTAKLQDSRGKPPVLVRIIADDQGWIQQENIGGVVST